MAARSESGASLILIFVLFISTHLVTTKSSFVTSQKTIPPFSCLPPGTGIWGQISGWFLFTRFLFRGYIKPIDSQVKLKTHRLKTHRLKTRRLKAYDQNSREVAAGGRPGRSNRCSTRRADAPDLAAGLLAMEASSSTLTSPISFKLSPLI